MLRCLNLGLRTWFNALILGLIDLNASFTNKIVFFVTVTVESLDSDT